MQYTSKEKKQGRKYNKFNTIVSDDIFSQFKDDWNHGDYSAVTVLSHSRTESLMKCKRRTGK